MTAGESPRLAPVAPCGAALFALQALHEKARRVFVDGGDAAAHAARLVVLLRQGHARAGGQRFHRLHIIHVVYFFDEGDNVAPGAAAKAVKALRFGVHHKRGRLFAVERAKARVGAPPPAQLHIALRHVHHVAALYQLFNIALRYHSLALLSCAQPSAAKLPVCRPALAAAPAMPALCGQTLPACRARQAFYFMRLFKPVFRGRHAART